MPHMTGQGHFLRSSLTRCFLPDVWYAADFLNPPLLLLPGLRKLFYGYFIADLQLLWDYV
jgi:hypothetical protein